MCVAKLIILSEDVDPRNNSTSYYWGNIVDGLSDHFEGMVVVSTSPEDGADFAHIANVQYEQCPRVKYDKNSIVSRTLGQIRTSFRFSVTLMRVAKCGDVVFSGTNPALMIFVIALLKRLIGFRWMLLVHDVFPENTVAAKLTRSDQILYRILKLVADRAYACADVLLAIGRDMASLLKTKVGNSPVQIEYVPNWVSNQDVRVVQRSASELLDALHFKDKIVFQFFGNMGRVQGLDSVLNAIKLVKSKKAVFLFIGSGAAEGQIRKFAEESGLENVFFISGMKFAENQHGLSACDVAMVSLAPGMNGLGVPSKTYFSLAAGRPIFALTDTDSEICQLIKEDHVGWFSPISDVGMIARTIDQICECNLSNVSVRARNVFEQKYEKCFALERYISILNDFLLPAPRCSNGK